jgi:threonine dehydrogenase-like Zn-dependent dehydrogenase
MQPVGCTRPGGHMGHVGVNDDVKIPGVDLFFAGNHLHGGPAPVRRFLPDRIDRTWDGKTEPGRVFDRTPPPRAASKGREAMDDHDAVKVIPTP